LRRQVRVAEPRPDRVGLLSTFISLVVFACSRPFDSREAHDVGFEAVHGISSPGMRSTRENVGLGDASVGVARNPLRDGAPPTGLFCRP
jgi:hypothetical protein